MKSSPDDVGARRIGTGAVRTAALLRSRKLVT
jgi:hypothetical protein